MKARARKGALDLLLLRGSFHRSLIDSRLAVRRVPILLPVCLARTQNYIISLIVRLNVQDHQLNKHCFARAGFLFGAYGSEDPERLVNAKKKK